MVALLATFTIYAPVVLLGALTLHEGWFDSLQISSPGAVSGFLDSVYGPLVDAADERLHHLLMFTLGLGLPVGGERYGQGGPDRYGPVGMESRRESEMVYTASWL